MEAKYLCYYTHVNLKSREINMDYTLWFIYDDEFEMENQTLVTLSIERELCGVQGENLCPIAYV